MASLLDKLTGKAPMIEDDDDDVVEEKASKEDTLRQRSNENIARKSSKKKSSIDTESLGIIFKWFVPVLCCIAAAIIMNFIMTKYNAGAEQQLSERIKTHKEKQDELTLLAQQAQSSKTKDTMAKTGVTYAGEINETDKAIAEDFFKKFGTWSTGDQFDNLRREAMKDYGYAEDSSFMQVFLPRQGSYHDKDTGKWFYQIDYDKLHSKFERMQIFKLPQDNQSVVEQYYAGIVSLSRTENTGITTKDVITDVYVTYRIQDGSLKVESAALVVDEY